MPTGSHAETIAAASAADLYNRLPAVAALPSRERYETLRLAFAAALAAYRAGLSGWPPVPSDN